MKKSTDVALLLLRLAAGLIFLPHGWSKVMGDGGPAAFAADLPALGAPAFLGYVVAWAELAGAALLIVGLLTRLDAFLLACTMAGAILLVKLPDARVDAPGALALVRALETELALFAMTVALLLAGAGRFSLDAALRVDERVGSLVTKKKAAAEAAAVRAS